MGSSCDLGWQTCASLVQLTWWRRSSGLRHINLKEACSAEKRIGTVARSRALDESAYERFEDSVVLTIVETGWRTSQCLHDCELCNSIGLQHLPIRFC